MAQKWNNNKGFHRNQKSSHNHRPQHRPNSSNSNNSNNSNNNARHNSHGNHSQQSQNNHNNSVNNMNNLVVQPMDCDIIWTCRVCECPHTENVCECLYCHAPRSETQPGYKACCANWCDGKC